jgi:hypothetical protein
MSAAATHVKFEDEVKHHIRDTSGLNSRNYTVQGQSNGPAKPTLTVTFKKGVTRPTGIQASVQEMARGRFNVIIA